MTERENDFIIFLTEQLQKAEQLEKERELIRASLDVQGRDEIERYQSEVKALEPKAKVELVRVIVPWWTELQRSGISTEIGRLLSLKRQTRMSLDEAFEHFRPYRIIREFRQSEQKGEPPFSADVSVIQSHLKRGRQDLVQLHKQIVVGPEYWKSVFVVNRVGRSNDLDLKLVTFLKDPPPFSAPEYREPREEYDIDLTQPNTLSGDVHPGSIIHFAQGIETGRIWNVLKNALGRE